jgi:hypothetical protein
MASPGYDPSSAVATAVVVASSAVEERVCRVLGHFLSVGFSVNDNSKMAEWKERLLKDEERLDEDDDNADRLSRALAKMRFPHLLDQGTETEEEEDCGTSQAR